MSDQTNDKLKIFLYGGDPSGEKEYLISKLISHKNNYKLFEFKTAFSTNYWENGAPLDDEGEITSYNPSKILEMVSNTDNYLIIISVPNENLIQDITALRQFGFRNFVPVFYLKSNYSPIGATLTSIQKFNQTNSSLIVASPLLDDNVKLYKTLTENKIDFIDFVNEPNRFGFFNKYEKIKIITSIQDPITHMFSMIYQHLSSPFDNYFNLLMRKSFKNQQDFTQKSDNINLFFTLYTQNRDKLPQTLYIDRFIEIFNNQIVNLYQHDFDKEKGYSIIKQGNIEVFVYQQEKLNDVAIEMSNWLGENQFNKWEKVDNDLPKWITPHYKLTQKEFKFSKEFFDDCYNQDWVKHFYSTVDIDKFKEKWQSHIN